MASSSDQFDEGGASFYFFILTFLCIYLFPATYNRVRARTLSTRTRARALERKTHPLEKTEENACKLVWIDRGRTCAGMRGTASRDEGDNEQGPERIAAAAEVR